MKNPIQSGRTMFARQIVAEFWMPRKASGRAVILCDGCPSVPSKKRLGEFLARKGYWVFHLRYRGSWESGGEFLKFSPHEDVLLVADSLNRGFTEMWSKVDYFLDISDITVIGASFGGAAALLSSIDPRIARAVALAPLTDLRYQKGGEPFSEFLRQIGEGFGCAYRAPKKSFLKLRAGKFYNPITRASEFDGGKVFIMHAVDDRVIPVAASRVFARRIALPKKNLRITKIGGHFSANIILAPEVWKQVSLFLKAEK